jgi:hypothetical protein
MSQHQIKMPSTHGHPWERTDRCFYFAYNYGCGSGKAGSHAEHGNQDTQIGLSYIKKDAENRKNFTKTENRGEKSHSRQLFRLAAESFRLIFQGFLSRLALSYFDQPVALLGQGQFSLD